MSSARFSRRNITINVIALAFVVGAVLLGGLVGRLVGGGPTPSNAVTPSQAPNPSVSCLICGSGSGGAGNAPMPEAPTSGGIGNN